MRHPLHALCPYFATFPEAFVAQQVDEFTNVGDLVFDPFCGRGTTLFESLLRDREAIGSDINPVAACVAGAKAAPPDLAATLCRVSDLEQQFQISTPDHQDADDFFRSCFETETLRQIRFLRRELDWRHSHVDRFIAAVVLGCLHGESHKSPHYLSNQMPRTISTRPDWSVRWWAARGLRPPQRDAFSVVRYWLSYRLSAPLPVRRGQVALVDARVAGSAFAEFAGQAALIVTSPPYLDTTNFRDDQWLRLWFLGGPDCPRHDGSGDDRYRREAPYWQFLTEAWSGCSALMRPGSVIVIRIGGKRLNLEALPNNLQASLKVGLPNFQLTTLRSGERSEIVHRQTRSFRSVSPASRFEYDFAYRLS